MTSLPHGRTADHAANPGHSSIRRMTARDVEAVVALERATPEAPHWSRDDYESILATQPGPIGRAALIAESHGQLEGFAVMRHLQLPSSPGHSQQVHCELESIVVAANLRARGIGLQLMNAMLDLAASIGADRFELEVRASNQPAIRLYKRVGLTLQGRRPNYYSDPTDDAVLMAKILNPAMQETPSTDDRK
ncbi:MAG TPA: GNAT family N-acetyltransferase [Acidisarcina sp.]